MLDAAELMVRPLPSFPGSIDLLVTNPVTGQKIADLRVLAGDFTVTQIMDAARQFCASLAFAASSVVEPVPIHVPAPTPEPRLPRPQMGRELKFPERRRHPA